MRTASSKEMTGATQNVHQYLSCRKEAASHQCTPRSTSVPAPLVTENTANRLRSSQIRFLVDAFINPKDKDFFRE